MSRLLFKGGTAPVFAPMNSSGDVAYDYINDYGNYLHKENIQNLFINGTSGEFPSLTVEERKQILENWHNYHGNHFKFIVHVGTCSLMETVELTKHALDFHADAIAVVAPFFIPPSDVDSLIEYFCVIANVISHHPSQRPVPLFYYHFPAFSHCALDLITFLQQAIERVAHFSGMKFTHDDFQLLKECQQKFGRQLQIFCGMESLYSRALEIGIEEGIFALFNSVPKYLFDLQQQRRRQGHDESEINSAVTNSVEQAKLEKILNLMQKHAKYGAIPFLKDFARVVGLNGLGRARLPLKSFNEEEFILLQNEFYSINNV